MVIHLINTFGLSIRKACKLSITARSTFLYNSKPEKDHSVIKEINNILSKYNKYGCGMIHLKLLQSGVIINHKRTERIYKKLGLQLYKRKGRKKILSIERKPVELPDTPGVIWAMDFIHDSIAGQRKLKILTVIDPVSRSSPLIYPAYSITGFRVAELLDRLVEKYGFPEYLQCDNGPEFRSRYLDEWCYKNKVKILFSRPGKPIDNCYIESFNGTFRYECLNSHHFESLDDARRIIEEWRYDYNNHRPQKSLKGLTPIQFEYKIKMLKTNLANGRKTG